MLDPAPLRPPTNAAGLFAVKGACQGCRVGWWRTTEPIPVYRVPGDTGPPIATLPAQTWAYVREALTLTKPTPGIVLRSGRQFKACERVYHVHTDYDEGEVTETVWRQGELLTYSPDDSDVAIAWLEEMAFVDRDQAGWWVRLEGSGGEAGWAWASERASEFQCKWDRDPEDICATAPKVPPAGR